MSIEKSQIAESDVENGHNLPLRGHRPVSVMLTDEQFKAFERAYLTPGIAASTNPSLRTALGNPTALGIVSLLLTLMPLSINFMQWGTNGRAGNITLVGSYYFTSFVGLEVAGIMEWILGNTFIFLVFTTLGTLCGSFGVLYDPQFNIAGSPLAVESAQVFNSGIGIWLLSWSFLLAIYFVGCLRINVVLSGAFLNVTLMLATAGGSYYASADSHVLLASRLLTAAGAFAFIASLLGWYLITSLVLQSVGGGGLPVGDLQRFWVKKNKAVKEV